MNTVQITLENFTDYPVGTKVEFNWGAYYPTNEGVITGFKYIPESKWDFEGVNLVGEYVDHETGETRETTIGYFVDRGIGTSLIEVPKQKSKKSPWSQA